MRFFIYDAFGDIAGNKKGYRTMRGAKQAQRMLSAMLWQRFEQYKDFCPYNTTVCQILNHPQ